MIVEFNNTTIEFLLLILTSIIVFLICLWFIKKLEKEEKRNE